MPFHRTYIQTVGTVEFPRYRIRDKRRGYWDGNGWSNHPRLFYQFNDAAQELNAIQEKEAMGKSRWKYEGQVNVSVIGARQFSTPELALFLAQAVKISLSEPAPERALVFVQIDWSKLRLLKN